MIENVAIGKLASLDVLVLRRNDVGLGHRVYPKAEAGSDEDAYCLGFTYL